MTARPTLTEAHALTSQLFDVVERARADFADVAASLGLTPLQARSLLWLKQPAPMRELAAHLACEPSNVTGLADRLEKAGLVERAPTDDRRVRLLQLTAGGSRLRADLTQKLAAGSTVTARLNAADRQALGRLLTKLLA